MRGGSRKFLLGAATAAHQVEGNNRHNDWWAFEQAGRLPFQSGRACEHFNRFREDFDLAKSLGHNCHRLSIEWSRVEPEAGRWDGDAIKHYGRVIAALNERGLTPVVTLHHFTLPRWVADEGGWENPKTPAWFARFVEAFLSAMSEPVPYWLTVNEPTVYVLQSYINGAWPPQENKSYGKGFTVFRNLAKGHRLARAVIKRHRPKEQVSFAHNALVFEASRAGRRADRIATRLRDWVFNELFFILIGGAKRGCDFIGLNYYTRCRVRSAGGLLNRLLGQACKERHPQQGVFSDIGWESYPQGLAIALKRFSRVGLPLFVTENGFATEQDSLRAEFLRQHLDVLKRALEQGIDVVGYLHWSLIDNFEWDMGTAPRFGLVAVDYDSQQRTPRASAGVLADALSG